MYHFRGIRNTVHNGKPFTFGNDVQVSEDVVSTLQDFQLEALKFAYACILEYDFFVFNDASGLGKTAVAAHLLNQISVGKKTLIILPNDVDIVRSWLFHIDVLTKLKVQHIVDGTATFRPDFEIYLVSWTHLRYMDYSLFTSITFDYVLLDNRGAKPMLCNQFCRNMLLDRLGQRVNIIISTIDITIDEKLMYIILRLGGRLPPNTLNLNAFQQEYKLPSLQQAQNNATLVYMEEYLQKRDRLEALCRNFRLRRYCHNFQKQLPLCTLENYKESLQQWETVKNEQMLASKMENTVVQTIKLKPIVAVMEKAANVEDVFDMEETVCMSPLVFESDSDSETFKKTTECLSSVNTNNLPTSTNDIIELVSSAEEDVEKEELKIEEKNENIVQQSSVTTRRTIQLRNRNENNKRMIRSNVKLQKLQERLSKTNAKILLKRRITKNRKGKQKCKTSKIGRKKTKMPYNACNLQRITRSSTKSSTINLLQGLELTTRRRSVVANTHKFKKPRIVKKQMKKVEKKLPKQKNQNLTTALESNQLLGFDESSISSTDYIRLPCAQRMSASDSPTLLLSPTPATALEIESLAESNDLILPETAKDVISLITSTEELLTEKQQTADSLAMTSITTPRKRFFRKRKSTPRSMPPPVNVLTVANICTIKSQQKMQRITSPDLFSSSCDIPPARKLPAAQQLINDNNNNNKPKNQAKSNMIKVHKQLSSASDSELNTEAWTTNINLSQKMYERRKFLYSCESTTTSCASDSNDSLIDEASKQINKYMIESTIAANDKTPTSSITKYHSRAGRILAAALRKSRGMVTPTSKLISNQSNSPACNALTKWFHKERTNLKSPSNFALSAMPITIPRRTLKNKTENMPIARRLAVRCRRLSLS